MAGSVEASSENPDIVEANSENPDIVFIVWGDFYSFRREQHGACYFLESDLTEDAKVILYEELSTNRNLIINGLTKEKFLEYAYAGWFFGYSYYERRRMPRFITKEQLDELALCEDDLYKINYEDQEEQISHHIYNNDNDVFEGISAWIKDCRKSY